MPQPQISPPQNQSKNGSTFFNAALLGLNPNIASKMDMIKELSHQLISHVLVVDPQLSEASIGKAFEHAREYFLTAAFMESYRETGVVSFFGSSSALDGDPTYMQTLAAAKEVSDLTPFYILTGGGPGCMAAANQGAGLARALGIGLSGLPNESANVFVDKVNMERVSHFSPRIAGLFENRALVNSIGGFGTVEESFKQVNLLEEGLITDRPVYWLGKKYWEPILSPMLDYMSEQKLVTPENREKYFGNQFDDPIALARHLAMHAAKNDTSRQCRETLEGFDLMDDYPIPDFLLEKNNVPDQRREELTSYTEKLTGIFSSGYRNPEQISDRVIINFFKDFADKLFFDAVMRKADIGKGTVLLGREGHEVFERTKDELHDEGKTTISLNQNDKKISVDIVRPHAESFSVPLRFKYTGLSQIAEQANEVVIAPGGIHTAAATYQMLCWLQTGKVPYNEKTKKRNFEEIQIVGRDWKAALFDTVADQMHEAGHINKMRDVIGQRNDDREYVTLRESA